MARAKFAVASRKRRKRVLKKAKGYFLGRKNLYRHAVETVERAMRYATIHRKQKKRDFRSLWILRINAACRQAGMSYSVFIAGLKKAKVALDRKIIADIAVHDPNAFNELLKIAKTSK